FPTVSNHLADTASKPEPLLATLSPLTTPPILSLTLRLGTTSCIRNTLLSLPSPGTAIPPLVPHILPSLLLPLIGPDPAFSDAETELLPPEMQLLGPDHQRESDPKVLEQIVESLFLILARGVQEAKAMMKGMGAYAVLRECHAEVEDEGIRESCERCVQLLMGDEAEGAEQAQGGEHGGGRIVEVKDDADGHQSVTVDPKAKGESDSEEEKMVEMF
ncbi:MAG: hypothetical protein Q9183_003647, partial [Haloplaca sp. 2 TL-2023]